MKKIIRVFPRKTSATPDDQNVRIKKYPDMFDEADEIHISVAFTWDLPIVDKLEKKWKHVAPVKIGGPALNEPGGDFTPGMYVKEGYVITSRGCPNRCWFCSVWRREGKKIRELPITTGSNILDDNLLACSDQHIKDVFAMLKGRTNIEFTGGLEAARLKNWHIKELLKLKPKQLFFAYDTPDDLPPLIDAGKRLIESGISHNKLRAYVFIGWPENKKRSLAADTFEAAEKRLWETVDAGFMPMAMLVRDEITGESPKAWRNFQRGWARPMIISSKIKNRNITPDIKKFPLFPNI